MAVPRYRIILAANETGWTLTMTDFDPAAAGWRLMEHDPMPAGVGMAWIKDTSDGRRYGMMTTPAHINPSGAIHGGVLMLFADHTLGEYVSDAADKAPNVTIQLNTHFLDAVHPGQFLELRGGVTRATKSLIFVRGIIGVGDRDVVAVDGIWRVFRPR